MKTSYIRLENQRNYRAINYKLLTKTGLLVLSVLLFSMSLWNFYTFFSAILLKPNFESFVISNLENNVIDNFREPVTFSYYVSKKGDTLLSISKELGISLSTLVSVNNIRSSLVLPGKRIIYPSKEGVFYSSKSRFSVFDVSTRYKKKSPYEVFMENSGKFLFLPGESCFVQGEKLSWGELTDRLGIGFLAPLKGRITSRFGVRLHPVLGEHRFHSGIDISAPYGSPVKVVRDGIVEITGYDDGYGYFIVVRHSKKLKTLYGHLSKILVAQGQKVKRGQIIGKVGNTGMATGFHLHFEVIKGNKKVNPRRYIRI